MVVNKGLGHTEHRRPKKGLGHKGCGRVHVGLIANERRSWGVDTQKTGLWEYGERKSGRGILVWSWKGTEDYTMARGGVGSTFGAVAAPRVGALLFRVAS